MVKRMTSITVDEEVLDKAREAHINISGAVEDAIKRKLNFVEVQVKDKCEFCGREGVRATVDNMNGLFWMQPYDQWICKSCLDEMARRIAISK